MHQYEADDADLGLQCPLLETEAAEIIPNPFRANPVRTLREDADRNGGGTPAERKTFRQGNRPAMRIPEPALFFHRIPETLRGVAEDIPETFRQCW